MSGEPEAIVLWEFPAADFAGWCDLVGEPEVATHAEYLALLAAVQADQERQGRRVLRARFPVARMRAELAARAWPNTPDHRAAVTGLLADLRSEQFLP